MAINPTCKVTYSLKPETVARVQELAAQWGIPKSEVIRRIVDKATMIDLSEPKVLSPLEALDRLQKNGISAEAAARYVREIRLERRAWGRKRK
jgi:predicted DNA-binding protein